MLTHTSPAPSSTSFISLPPMSLRRSERLATTASRPTTESIRPTRIRTSKQPPRQSTGSRGPLRSIHPGVQPSRSQIGVKRRRVDSDNSDDGNQEADNDGGLTDPAKVKRPVTSLISPILATSWRVYQKHDMCFIFDSTSPARRFKRGMIFNEEAEFPEDTHDGDVTETDGPSPGWMPVDPAIVRCVSKHFMLHSQTDSTIAKSKISLQMLNYSQRLHGLGGHNPSDN